MPRRSSTGGGGTPRSSSKDRLKDDASDQASRSPSRESVLDFSPKGEEVVRRSETDILIMNGKLEDLLAEQLVAVERALAFNHVITQQLASERKAAMQSEEDKAKQSPPCTPSAKKRSVSFIDTDLPSSLTQPLLSDAMADGESPGQRDSVRSSPTNALDKPPKIQTSLSQNLFPTFGWSKKLVVDCLSQPVYRVEDFYKETGVWSSLATNSWFNNMTLVVILINTIWIAVDTDWNKADVLIQSDWEFIVMDNFFCTYFTFEMVVRFMAFQSGWFALQDNWFVFDGCLVSMMIWETWVMSLLFLVVGISPSGSGARAGSILRIFRIFRLTRVARTARLLSSVPELMILAKGMFIAMRSVAAILCLLGLIIYIFAIIFTQLLAHSTFNKEHDNKFDGVVAAGNFLLLQVLCGFDADFADDLFQDNLACYFLFLLYLLFGSLTIMNMLIGILCDVVSAVSEEEKAETFEREMEIKVESLAQSLDQSNRGSVGRQDFETVIKQPEVILSLTDLGVDVVGLMDFAFFVFQENEELSYTNFLHMVLQFRGSKQATVKDVMDVRKQMSMQLAKVLDTYDTTKRHSVLIQQALDTLSSRLDGVNAPVNVTQQGTTTSANDVTLAVDPVDPKQATVIGGTFDSPSLVQRGLAATQVESPGSVQRGLVATQVGSPDSVQRGLVATQIGRFESTEIPARGSGRQGIAKASSSRPASGTVDERLAQALEIRNRIESLGVAVPEATTVVSKNSESVSSSLKSLGKSSSTGFLGKRPKKSEDPMKVSESAGSEVITGLTRSASDFAKASAPQSSDSQRTVLDKRIEPRISGKQNATKFTLNFGKALAKVAADSSTPETVKDIMRRSRAASDENPRLQSPRPMSPRDAAAEWASHFSQDK